MTTLTSPPSAPAASDEESMPACVLIFNASDPSGAGGLTADITTIASVGGHALPVVTGSYIRDTSEIFDHAAFDDEVVTEQARTMLEDVPVQVIKVGFVGDPENLSAIAEISSDYPDIPVVAYMPNLSWWQEDKIDSYLDAFSELLLPQTSVLVGNHSTLWRWLLPDWNSDRSPTARDIATAAAKQGVPYTLVTGIPLPEQHVDNVLASPQSVLGHVQFELFDAVFAGADSDGKHECRLIPGHPQGEQFRFLGGVFDVLVETRDSVPADVHLAADRILDSGIGGIQIGDLLGGGHAEGQIPMKEALAALKGLWI